MARTPFRVVWDDHGLVDGLTFPTSLRIAGLLPRTPAADPNLLAQWTPTGGCANAVACTNEQPPDGDTSFVTSGTVNAMQMLCLERAAAGGVFGNHRREQGLVHRAHERRVRRRRAADRAPTRWAAAGTAAACPIQTG